MSDMHGHRIHMDNGAGVNRTFDRIPKFDPRSRSFPIRAVVPKKPRSYTWRVNGWLDQGQEGACIGFSWAHELMARPAESRADESIARTIYKEAQKIDEWPGENYQGTSVLAGAKVVIGTGHMREYRWCFSLNDLVLAVGYAGPVVLGVWWFAGMASTDEDGFIHPSGRVYGGHAILCHSVSVKHEYFKIHNSWGRGWGVDGEAKVSFEDMEYLLSDEGEACVPIGRKRIL